MTETNQERVFYVPATDDRAPCTIDTIGPDGRGKFGGRTLDEIRKEYPTAIECSIDTAIERDQDYWRTDPIEITEADYWEMLEILPPVSWVQRHGSESFKMSERTSGSITGIYCQIGDRFFTFQDVIYMKHDHIIEKVINSAAYKKTAA